MPVPDALLATGDAGRLARTWLHRSLRIIADSADALNAMNVFPVSDSDTGSNLELTLAGIADALPQWEQGDVDAVVHAAVLSAHGNSGSILAEMITSVCGVLAEPVGPRGSGSAAERPRGSALASLLRAAAVGATEAVAQPVAGTILSVADAAAEAAERAARGAHPGDALAVARAARSAAAQALARTPEQLAVLADAGVVDAGGQAYVVLLDVLVEVLGGEPAAALAPVAASSLLAPPAAGDTEDGYEVMYVLTGADPADLTALRGKLSELGHSVVVVGDQRVAQVHVHLPDAGAAVEAGLAYGTPSRIRVTALAGLPMDRMRTEAGGRTVIAVVAGPGLAATVGTLGATALLPTAPDERMADLAAVLEATTGDVVVLPNDMESLEIAGYLATQLRRGNRRIAVIPTVSQVQGLAALAVHEPTADFEEAVVAMSSVAGHTRHGAVTIAESPAMTMAGRCEAGDVLGLVDADFVEIGDSLVEVAWRVSERLLSAGGELITVVTGADASDEIVTEFVGRLEALARVEVEVVAGGQSRYPLLLGVE